MRVYISGPMTGVADYEERFNAAEELLRKDGFKVLNPSRWGWFLRYLPYKVALAFDICMMCRCDRVFMLDGWTESNGARAEYAFAQSTGMIITYER